MFFFFGLGIREVQAYIYGLYISYSFAFLASSILILSSFRKKEIQGSGNVLRKLFKLGSVMQLGNIIQFFNYLSLIHISEPTRRTPISYAVFCLKKKKKK